MPKIGKDAYYMQIAKVAAKRADCTGTKVGAVIVVEDRVVSTGYNGAPDGVANCSQGGCPRCAARKNNQIQTGQDLDKCLCVHAEENAILSAARHGIRINGCIVYTTVQPCLGCLRQIIQVKAKKVLYLDTFAFDAMTRQAYERLAHESGVVIKRLDQKRKAKERLLEDSVEVFQIPSPSKN